jgi:hypothetical protein
MTAKELLIKLDAVDGYWDEYDSEAIPIAEQFRAEAYNNGRKDATLDAMQHGFYSPDDLNAIRAEARAKALSEAADRAEQWFYNTIASAELIELEHAWIPMRMKQIATLRSAITQEADK